MGGALLINPDRSFVALLKALQIAEQESYCFAGDLDKLTQQASDLPERMRMINRNAIEIAPFLKIIQPLNRCGIKPCGSRALRPCPI